LDRWLFHAVPDRVRPLTNPRRCSKIKETALSAGMRNPDRITPLALAKTDAII
jgi:hypothetical protein